MINVSARHRYISSKPKIKMSQPATPGHSIFYQGEAKNSVGSHIVLKNNRIALVKRPIDQNIFEPQSKVKNSLS